MDGKTLVPLNGKYLVVGHTDSQGSYAFNERLSRGRAESVIEELVEQYGISTDRLKPVGVAFASPETSNATSGGREKNRRVELVEVEAF